MVYRCTSCGAPSEAERCQYCGTVNKKEEDVLEVIISGDMNYIKFDRAMSNGKETSNKSIKITSDMGTFFYQTARHILLTVSGDMNNIRMQDVNFSVVKNSGDMNTIR